MKRSRKFTYAFLIIISASLASVATKPAIAAGRADGTVARADANTGLLVLVDGRSFVFSDRATLRSLVPGQTVGVNFFGEGQGIRTFDPFPLGSETPEPQ